ncbi:hypothetical protein V3C99_018414 [Haemonchus contortus]
MPSGTPTVSNPTTTLPPSITTKQSTTTAVLISTVVTTSPPTTTTVIPKPSLSCLFVGDMYNFDANETAYDQERSFIRSTSQSLFDQGNGFKAGLSLYGYADAGQRFPNAGLNSMSSTFAKFDNDLMTRMTYDEDGNDETTGNAINSINGYEGMSAVNCLIFFSAQKNTAGLPELTPMLAPIAKIVAVGFDDTDLTGIVKMNGNAVTVPYAFSTDDVQSVVKAVLS